MQLNQRLRTLPDRLAPESLLDEIEQEVNLLPETTGSYYVTRLLTLLTG